MLLLLPLSSHSCEKRRRKLEHLHYVISRTTLSKAIGINTGFNEINVNINNNETEVCLLKNTPK